MSNSERSTRLTRETNETSIEVTLNLDGTGSSSAKTGIGFLDHMIMTLAKHSGIELSITCKGDLEVDDHHTAEDCALALGSGIDACLGDRAGIQRFGNAYAPLDEALARSVLDLSGRPWPQVSLDTRRDAIGGLACENASHFLSSLATAMRANLHVDVLRGENDHHKIEAAFKATALALKAAITRTSDRSVPSTKGTLA